MTARETIRLAAVGDLTDLGTAEEAHILANDLTSTVKIPERSQP
jgi:hypothetical protein